MEYTQMKRSTFIAAIAASAIGVTTLAAMAYDGRPDFSTLDADGNGEVSLTEMQARGDARFEEADTDGDGFLSVEELEAASRMRASTRVERMMTRMDANEDGMLSPDEMTSPRRDPARYFERMDADKSGGISEAEFEKASTRMMDHRGNKNRDMH